MENFYENRKLQNYLELKYPIIQGGMAWVAEYHLAAALPSSWRTGGEKPKMGKRVFMFPGQGSQYIGMGKEFYDTMPNAKAVIDLASEQTGLDIPALCFEENDKLNITEYTQICMLAVEAAISGNH